MGCMYVGTYYLSNVYHLIFKMAWGEDSMDRVDIESCNEYGLEGLLFNNQIVTKPSVFEMKLVRK